MFGVEREMKESGEKGGTEDVPLGDAGGQPFTFTDAQAQNSRDWFIADSFSFGVEREMKMNGERGLADGASADTSAPQASGFIVEFDRPVDPSPLSVGDLADWQSNYGTGGDAVLGQPVTFTATVGGPIFGEGGDDLATYEPDIVDIDLLLSATVDMGGIPVSLPEYGLFIA